MSFAIKFDEIQVPIIDDDIKKAMTTWLEKNSYLSIEIKSDTSLRNTVSGVHATTGKRLIIECAGESATGFQLPRSWPNVASAILSSLIEIENQTNSNEVGVAFPDTQAYRHQMINLDAFCKKIGIAVYWVSKDGQIRQE
ncbi:MAG: hypothetical protein ACXU7Z_12145 [Burkholderiaceae bacterium]